MTEPTRHKDAEAVAIGTMRPITLTGEVDAGIDLAGVVLAGDFLILGSDEGHRLQVLSAGEVPGVWHLQHRPVLAERGQATDIAALGFDRGHLYIICSHTHKRRRMRPEFSVRKNRQRMFGIDVEPSRNRLYRVPFDPQTGKTGKVRFIDLSKRLRKDPLLQPFFGVPGRENGIEIGGIAPVDGRLHLGFRGPVLRDDFVPLMVLDYDRPKDYALTFVRLDGQGIRDLVALKNGFLLLSSPANDARGPYRLWWWDGMDQVPGKGRAVREAVLLGAVSTPGGARAEGLACCRRATHTPRWCWCMRPAQPRSWSR